MSAYTNKRKQEKSESEYHARPDEPAIVPHCPSISCGKHVRFFWPPRGQAPSKIEVAAEYLIPMSRVLKDVSGFARRARITPAEMPEYIEKYSCYL